MNTYPTIGRKDPYERQPGDAHLTVSRELADRLANNDQQVQAHYSHLRQVMDALGSDTGPQDHSRLKITLTHDVEGKHGDFDAGELNIRVGYNTEDTKTTEEKKARDIQIAALHELGHYFDETIRPLTRKERIVRRLASVAERYTYLTAFTLMGTSVATGVSAAVEARPAVTEVLASTTGASGIAALATVGLLTAYHYSKREKIAREAEQLDLPPIFTIEDIPRRR